MENTEMINKYIKDHGGNFGSVFGYTIQRLKSSDFTKNVTETYMVRLLLVGLGLVSSVITARALGPEGRGVFAAAMTAATLGIQFGNLGMHASNTYYVSKNRSLLPVLVGNSMRLSLLVGGAGGLATWLFFWIWPGFAPVTNPLLALALGGVSVGLIYMLFQNLLIGIQEIRSYNQIEVGGRLFSLGIILAVVWFSKPGPFSIYLASLAGTLVCAVWAYAVLGRHMKERPRFSGEVFQKTIYYGFKAYINAFFAFLVLKVDLLMVKYYLGSGPTGYYSIASNMADMLYLLPAVAGSILFPKLSAKLGAREKWTLAHKAMWILVAIMAPLALVAALLAGPVVGLLYGSAFLPSVPAFWILCGSMIFYAANNMVSYYFAATGFPWFSVYVWIIVSFMNIGLNWFLIPAYGIQGAAWSSLACYSSVLFLQYFYVVVKGPQVES